MGGQPCIRGLRFPVATVVALLADGMGTEQILTEHPDLTAEDIGVAAAGRRGRPRRSRGDVRPDRGAGYVNLLALT
jgi:hypothetical protein